jgi:transmembrane sensor
MPDGDFENTVDWPLLARYFSGEAGPAERSELERWIADDPPRQEEVASLRRLWDDAGLTPSPRRIEAMWSALASEMARDRASPPDLPRHTLPPSSPPRHTDPPAAVVRSGSARAALAVLVVLVLAAGLWLALEPAGRPAGAGHFETGVGQVITFRLGDGSSVTLGPSSELWGSAERRGPRELELRGEAVFHVASDLERPLRVRAGSSVTEDPGSVFAVRAYPGHERVQVAVIAGRVALRSANAPEHSGTLLEGGQVGWLDLAGRVEVQETATPHAYVGWTAGG